MNKPFSRVVALKAAALMATSTYVTVALGLVVSSLIARGLGPEDYGRYAYLLWLSGLLVMLGNNGLGITAIRFVSECLGRGQTDEAANVHGWLRRRQWISVAAVLASMLFALPWLKPSGWDGRMDILIAVLVVSVLAKSIYMFDVSVAKGHRAFWVEAWSTMIMSLLYATGVAILVVIKAGLNEYLLFFACICVGHVIVTLPMLRRGEIAAGNGPCDEALIGRIKPHLAWTVVQMVVATLSNKTMETFLLNSLIGPAEIGYFTIAGNLARGGVELVSSSLTTVLMPAMAHAYGAGGIRQVNVIVSDALRYCLFLGLILAGLGLAWSSIGVMLMYGPKYEAVIDVLRIMVVVGGLTLMESAFGALLSTTENQHVRAQVALLSVVISTLTAIALVPAFGLMGAVMSYALSRVLVFAYVARAVTKRLDITLPLTALRRLALSGAAAAALPGLLAWWIPTVPMQTFCGVLYVALLVAASVRFDAWQHKDVSLLLTVARKKPSLTGRLIPPLERWAARLEPSA